MILFSVEINSGLVNDTGLFLDIIGAFFLAKSFLFKGTKALENESASFWDGNPYLLPSLVIQRLEAKVGFIFLAFGFALQFLSNTDLFHTGANHYVLLSIAFSLLVWLTTFLILKKFSLSEARKAVKKVNGQIWLNKLVEGIEGNEKIHEWYGDVLEIPKELGESDTDYRERIKSFLEKD